MTNVDAGEDVAARDPLVDQAVRLFEFLARTQQLKTSSPRTVDSYQREGSILWLGDLPDHPAVLAAHRGGDPEPDDALLTIERVARLDPPAPDELLTAWLNGPLDNPERPPELRESISVVDEEASADAPHARHVRVDECPAVREHYDRWLEHWQTWADQELVDRPVRALYGDLFSTYTISAGRPEEFELVVGIGCLAWLPTGHPAVRRHLLTAPASIHLDDDTGHLTVSRIESADAVTVELDMLDPGLVTNHLHINDVRTQARGLTTHPLHRDEVGALVRRLVHTMDADGQYRDEDDPPDSSSKAVAAFAPALILRKRSQQGLVDIFQTIVDQLTDANVVPDGVLPLIDPDHRPQVENERADGALVLVDDDPFLPMPVNDVQLRIIRQVDSHAQTLVQGPPGTGKTHTAAALISHLLAQGKRVLVTAHTDRALKEVRDKLPAAIKPLSVAVVGSAREDMSDLKVAVARIAASAGEHDPRDAERTVRECLDTIDVLRRKRAELYRQLLDAREHEVRVHEHAGYRGTLAAIARQHIADAERFGWLNASVEVPADKDAPLNNSEAVEWLSYLRDADLTADEPESRRRLLDLSTIPEPRVFADLVAAETQAADDDAQHEGLKGHVALGSVSRLEPAVRAELQHRLHQLAEEADDLAHRREEWMNEALSDARSSRADIWQARSRQLSALIERATPLIDQLGSLTDVRVTETDMGALVSLATVVSEHIVTGGKVKTTPEGIPKLGALTPKAVKQAKPLFDHVRVDGLPPTTPAQLSAFIAWAEAVKILAALDRAWPDNVPIPPEDTLHERLQWHITELRQLRRVLSLAEKLEQTEQHLSKLGLPRPDWNNAGEVRSYASLVDVAAAADVLAATSQPLERIALTVAEVARWADAAPCVQKMHQAVLDRDHEEYSAARHRLERLREVRDATIRRDELAERLSVAAPALRDTVEATASDPSWNGRLAAFTDAWAWAATGTWLGEQEAADVNALQAEATVTDERIRCQVETLSATRAWGHAVSADRLTGRARANLEQYASLVRRLGKGTGKYGAQRKVEIRQAMDRCRSAVPVWILPIYRIAEQLKIQPDMFDVVIVDEASQAGLEATFLQYLAPRIVVIGDDKQVSPSAVGVDQQQLRDLAAQYLYDDDYRSSWQDPQRSLFDEAKMRFGGMLTLTEHRRCMPEIIGFSNRVAYEPDGIRLIPVRQYGADRLEPIKPVYLKDGYARGTTNKINPVEVEAIVDQVEKCIADPRYDGLTFGVISLLGGVQAKTIEKRLLERLPPEEWAARKLHCGDATAFQGAERDVMFLSMVAAPEPGKSHAALTRDLYVQRYNVAASRAKDQMWLFHSIAPHDVSHPEDMRFQLLDYCYGVVNRMGGSAEDGAAGQVPEDVRVEPFESLFEQRVCNRLIDRGYTVIPQYPAGHYRLDLIVVGAKSRLAIECDGDAWHGPDVHQQDLARQRDLERCGWEFFRIRESDFYVDPAGTLAQLWARLTELDIHPSGWTRDQESDPVPAPVDDDLGKELGINEQALANAAGAPREFRTTPALSQALRQDALDKSPTITVRPSHAAPARTEIAWENKTTSPSDHIAILVCYNEFTGVVVPAMAATPGQRVEGLLAVVAAEGPVIGYRLHSAYVKASEGQRVSKQIAKVLNSAITAAVRRGLLIGENPLGEPGVKPRTFRLPDQSAVHVRPLGPRSLHEMPPSELATVLSQMAEKHGWYPEEALFRATLGQFGLKRLTVNVTDRLRSVLPLAHDRETV